MLRRHVLPTIVALLATSAVAAQVAPVPAPAPPAGPVVILSRHALDGRGESLRNARIGIANGRITSLAAAATGTVIDLRGYTVLPGWIDTHVHLASHFDRTGRIATPRRDLLTAPHEEETDGRVPARS